MLPLVLAFWKKKPPPPTPPPVEPSTMLTPAGLLSVVVCWVLPAVFLYLSSKEKISVAAKTAVSAKGTEVPKDIIRRQEALKSQSQSFMDKLLAFGTWFFLVVPLVWAFATQESPTAAEQLGEWKSITLTHLADGQLSSAYVACALLMIERLTYTWVHTFTGSYIKFANSSVGKMLGSKPLDVVLNLFFINKTVQMGTFIGWYFYMIDFESPWQRGFSFEAVTRLQWVMLFQAFAVGQTLNYAIYKKIGKAGVYYGYRLGIDVPWVTGYPFNVGIPHPQYIGSCITCIGVNAFCACPIHLANGWLSITAWQCIAYTYMGLVEDYL